VTDATLRRFPYPYRGLLAIASDLDETPDAADYLETMRYLNTTRQTASGEGVGLEVGNSIYFDMPPGQFAYWSTDDRGRALVRDLIRSGHVDCLHSYGDLATTRAHAGRALDELSRHGCQLRVWVDHAVAPSNFGSDIMEGRGDVEGSPVFHADLTCGAGVEFVWRGRVTSVVGQNTRRRLSAIANRHHGAASLRTLVKECAKGVLARAGHAKYAMHGANSVLRSVRLRSGQPVHEFLRSNPHWAGVSHGETADGLGAVLTDRFLGTLKTREAACVLYTHLGKRRDRSTPFSPASRRALERLADSERRREVLVTTTARLLAYCRTVERAAVTTKRRSDGSVDIVVSGVGDRREDLDGLTLYVGDPARARLVIGGTPRGDAQINAPDHTGRPSLSLPWRRLEFPRP
jgi:hypothetical protein